MAPDRRAQLDGLGVIFDIDGVLVDSYAAHLESWKQLAAENNRTINEAQFAATFGKTSRDIIRELFGPHIVDDDVRRLDDRKEAIYRDLIRHDVPIMPGATGCARALRDAGARLAVGSSGPPENVQLVLEAFRPIVDFHAVVTGADVRRGKPDPQVFLLAADRLGLPPACCLVIEDAPAGIEAAHRAGMRCIALAIRPDRRAVVSSADAVVDALARLTPSLVRSLCAIPGGTPGQ
ncbi:MAG: HAD family phosphatase [Phycisphaerae bacterium]|nr:HAD family phosphatase [Phycisphaerae bacterium]